MWEKQTLFSSLGPKPNGPVGTVLVKPLPCTPFSSCRRNIFYPHRTFTQGVLDGIGYDISNRAHWALLELRGIWERFQSQLVEGKAKSLCLSRTLGLHYLALLSPALSFFFHFLSFHTYGCFAYICMFTPHVCLIPEEAEGRYGCEGVSRSDNRVGKPKCRQQSSGET